MFLRDRSIKKELWISHGSRLEIFDFRCISPWNIIVRVRPDNYRYMLFPSTLRLILWVYVIPVNITTYIMGGYCIKLEFPSVMAILANIWIGGGDESIWFYIDTYVLVYTGTSRYIWVGISTKIFPLLAKRPSAMATGGYVLIYIPPTCTNNMRDSIEIPLGLIPRRRVSPASSSDWGE